MRRITNINFINYFSIAYLINELFCSDWLINCESSDSGIRKDNYSRDKTWHAWVKCM